MSHRSVRDYETGVIYLFYLIYFFFQVIEGHLFIIIVFLGVGFATRKEAKFPRYQSYTRTTEKRVHQRCQLSLAVIYSLAHLA